MSCVVKTQTPFISKEILLEALEKCGYKYNIKSGKIYIPALHMYRNTYFQFIGGKYVLSHEYFNFDIDSFLKEVSKSYNDIYEMKLKGLREIEKEKAEKLKKEEAERLEKQRLKEEAQILERERIEREELERLEKERLAYVESQKKAIMEKAKVKGYRVVEVKKENKIQLTLVREIR